MKELIKYLHEVERLNEQTECEIRQGEIEDEYIAWGSHRRAAGEDDIADETVTRRAERDESREGENQRRLSDRVKVTGMKYKFKFIIIINYQIKLNQTILLR